jgi:hypothetical protein
MDKSINILKNYLNNTFYFDKNVIDLIINYKYDIELYEKNYNLVNKIIKYNTIYNFCPCEGHKHSSVFINKNNNTSLFYYNINNVLKIKKIKNGALIKITYKNL